MLRFTALILLLPSVLLQASPAVAMEGSAPAPGVITAPAADDRLEAEYEKLAALVRERKAPVKAATGVLDIEGLPALGAADAPVTIIEFGSVQCGFCRRHAYKTLPSLLDYVDKGQVRYVYHDYPTATEQRRVVEATLCAADQGGYFALRSGLVSGVRQPGAEQLRHLASIAGLDVGSFEDCVGSGRKEAKVSRLVETARGLGIRGTPTFLIGSAGETGNQVRIERRIDGAQPAAVFSGEIDALLDSPG
jgi:protein-disulfide isomerase